MAGTIPEMMTQTDVCQARCTCQCSHHKQKIKRCSYCMDATDETSDSEYENIDASEVKKQHRAMFPSRIVLDIGGQKFSTCYSTLAKHPRTRLGRLSKADPSYDRHRGEYYYDRNPRLFSNILDYYRTGELHFPQDLCGPFIKKELAFWEISESVIAPCCLKNYKEYEEEQKTLELLETMFDGNQHPEETFPPRRTQDICTRWRKKIWHFLEFPSTSVEAKIWAYVYLILLLCSIAVICMETLPDFRVASDDKYTCADVTHNRTNQTTDQTTAPAILPVLAGTNPKVHMYITTDPHPVLAWSDDICSCVFTLELFLRFLVWPNKLQFFKSFFNVIDILAIVPMFVISMSTKLTPCYWTETRFLSSYLVLSFVCVFRAVRILKLIKHSRGLQIMYLAMKASFREIMLLLLLIVIGTLIFSTMIYYAEFSDDENFMNIPIGFWWSIVTMTTVGYGDVTPKTGMGYLVGSVCALTGMLITGLPIPVIANSFHLYYTYAKLKDKLQLQRQSSRSKAVGYHNEAYETDRPEKGELYGNGVHGNRWHKSNGRYDHTDYHILDHSGVHSLDHL